MMRILLFLMFGLHGGFALAQNTGKGGPQKVKHDALSFNNNIAFYNGKPFTGLSYTFWANKRINEEFSWYEGAKDGLYKEFTEEGVLVTKVTYVSGIKEGPYEYYYPNSVVQSKGQFRRGELDGEIWGYYTNGNKKYWNNYVLGIRHGPAQTWFPNGTVEQISNFVNGIPHGEVVAYYKDAVIRYEMEYKMGVRHGKYYKFHKTGCPALESYYKNGKEDSVIRAWDEITCQLLEEGYYKNGEKSGTFISYGFHNKDTLKLLTYKYNKLNGPFMEWRDSTIEVIGNYADGLPHGYWQYGLTSNYQHREGNYENGVMVGEWKFYDLKGRILMVHWYDEEGNLIKEKLYKRPRRK